MSLRAKEEYLRAVHGRYRQATRAAKGQILDEFDPGAIRDQLLANGEVPVML